MNVNLFPEYPESEEEDGLTCNYHGDSNALDEQIEEAHKLRDRLTQEATVVEHKLSNVERQANDAAADATATRLVVDLEMAASPKTALATTATKTPPKADESQPPVLGNMQRLKNSEKKIAAAILDATTPTARGNFSDQGNQRRSLRNAKEVV